MTRVPRRIKNSELQEAADPTTPGPQLQYLWDVHFASFYQWQYVGIERVPTPLELALAENPNTPPKVLRQLANQCPAAVARNPAISLVLILEPAFFHDVASPSLQELLRLADTSAVVLRFLMSHPNSEIAEGAEWHVGLHGETVSNLDEAVDRVRRGLPVTRTEALEELFDLGLLPETLAAQLDTAPPSDGPPKPETAQEVMFAETPPIDPERLVQWLANGPRRDGSSPEDGLLAPELPLEETLLHHELDTWNVEARKCVAADARQPGEVLAILARHRLPAVRARVAGNPSAPANTLELLSHSTLAYELSPLAANPAAPVEVVARLAQHDWMEVAGSALLHPRLPQAEVERLAGHREPWIRARAARHPACSPETLLHLAGDASRMVRRRVAEAPATPAGAELRMIAPALTEAARDDDAFCRWVALTHPQVPSHCLQAAAGSGCWRDRLAAALHRATPREALEPLCEDGHALVRAAARATMRAQEVDSQS